MRMARQPVARRPREVSKFIDRVQDVADALGEFFSEFCQRDLSCTSLQQDAAESFLQFLDLHGQGRLRDRTCFGCASKVAMTYKRIEIAKLSKRYLEHQNILSASIIKINFP